MNLIKTMSVAPILALVAYSAGATASDDLIDSESKLAFKEGIFVGGSIGKVNYDRDDVYGPIADLNPDLLSSDSKESLALGLNVGYRINPYWAVNLDVEMSQIEGELNGSFGDEWAKSKTELTTVNIRPEVHLIWPVSETVEVYGLVGANIGLSRVEQEDSDSAGGASSDSLNTSSFSPAYGVGGQWLFDESWSVKGEVTRYDVDVELGGDYEYETTQTEFSLGVTYHFG